MSAMTRAMAARSGRSRSASAVRRSAARCKSRSRVEGRRAPAGASRASSRARCGARRGIGWRRSGMAAARASARSSAVTPPAPAARASSTASRARRACSGCRSGRSASARRANAMSSAASAASSSAGGRPNQASAPALSPSRLPPCGARVSQMPRISSLLKRASSCSARSISIPLLRSVLGRGSSSRAACIVSVEPPDTTRPARAHCIAARAIAKGSTPACRRKRASSAAISMSSRCRGTSPVPVCRRQTPPGAGRVESVRPSRSITSTPAIR